MAQLQWSSSKMGLLKWSSSCLSIKWFMGLIPEKCITWIEKQEENSLKIFPYIKHSSMNVAKITPTDPGHWEFEFVKCNNSCRLIMNYTMLYCCLLVFIIIIIITDYAVFDECLCRLKLHWLLQMAVFTMLGKKESSSMKLIIKFLNTSRWRYDDDEAVWSWNLSYNEVNVQFVQDDHLIIRSNIFNPKFRKMSCLDRWPYIGQKQMSVMHLLIF